MTNTKEKPQLLERQRKVDAKMAALHAEQAATDRKCSDCQNLPEHLFGKDKSRKSGFNPRCKPCNRLHIKGYCKFDKPERDPTLSATPAIQCDARHLCPSAWRVLP